MKKGVDHRWNNNKLLKSNVNSCLLVTGATHAVLKQLHVALIVTESIDIKLTFSSLISFILVIL